MEIQAQIAISAAPRAVRQSSLVVNMGFFTVSVIKIILSLL
jgi:hypothetical protein